MQHPRPVKLLSSLHCLGIILLLLVPIASVQGETLRIYYSASLNGNIDGCNCDMAPTAGLVKRAAFLRSREAPEPSLLLDAGDIFDAFPDEELAHNILEVYRELGYDFIAVGDQELSNGLDSLLEYGRDFPLVCHNLSVLVEGTMSSSPTCSSNQPVDCPACPCYIWPRNYGVLAIRYRS